MPSAFALITYGNLYRPGRGAMSMLAGGFPQVSQRSGARTEPSVVSHPNRFAPLHVSPFG